MKKLLYSLVVLFVLSACQPSAKLADLPKINGYWEISSVEFPDGNHKDYSINESFDYFNFKNQKGYRKKVMPQLDGTFLTNDLSESIVAQEKDGKLILNCKTAYAQWQETILTLTNQELVIENDSHKKYHYKKAQPINLIPHEQKTK